MDKIICVGCKQCKESISFSEGRVRCKDCRRQMVADRNASRAQRETIIIPDLSKCTLCKETKPAGDFYPRRTEITGLDRTCKICKHKFIERLRIRRKLRTKIEIPSESECKQCKLTKPFMAFSVDKSEENGLAAMCKMCVQIKNAKREEERHSRDIVGVKLRTMAEASKHRAKVKSLPYELSIEYMERFRNLTHCPVLGIQLEWENKISTMASPSLDRIIPEWGYVPGNIQVLSYLANSMKRDANLETIRRFANWALSFVASETQKIAPFYVNPTPTMLPQSVLDIAAQYA